MGRRQKIEKEVLRDNLMSYNYVELRLWSLLNTAIRWEGLPPEIDPIFLERSLRQKGQVVFFKDDIVEKYVCLPFADGGGRTIYDVPTERHAYTTSNNGYNPIVYEQNSVIIYNNTMRASDQLPVAYYTKRIAEALRTVDINLYGQRKPVVISCAEEQRTTAEILFRQYEDGYPAIIARKGTFSDVPFEVLNTGAPFIADKVYSLVNQWTNDFLSTMGIENNDTEKKERLITDEAHGNDGLIEMSRKNYLAPREYAAEQINRMFGLNIKPVFRSELPTMINLGGEFGVSMDNGDPLSGGDNE